MLYFPYMARKKPLTSPKLPRCAGHYAYQQTLATYPIAWYEKLTHISGLGLTTITIGWWLQTRLGLFPNIWLSVIGLLAYLLAWLGDVFTTHAIMALKQPFDDAQIEFPWHEGAIFLPKHPTLRDQLLSFNTALTLPLALLAWLVPSFGLGIGLQHALAAYGNRRELKRLQLCCSFIRL